MKKFAKLAAVCVLLTAACLLSAFKPADTDGEELLKSLTGTWSGTFHVVTGKNKHINDKATMNIVEKNGDYQLYLTVESCEARYLTLKEWGTDGERLEYTFNDLPWQASVSVRPDGAKKLVGVYSQYGEQYDVTFTKRSDTPVDMGAQPQYLFEDEPDAYWLEKMQKYPNYEDGGASIPFTYELNDKSKVQPLIKSYGLDALMVKQTDAAEGEEPEAEGKMTDVERMLTLMNVVCDNFKHDGASGMPEQRDAMTVVAYYKQKGGIECSGLSIILSELLRAYGVPAKTIKCTPVTDDGEFCHVVVHAYSRELKQWIMLDPTYRLVLKDAGGKYVNLQTLRESLISGKKLVPNETAGHNGRPFYMDYYRMYMTKNAFRFSSTVQIASGTDGQARPKQYMLQPAGFPIWNAQYRGEIPTASAEAFWAAPAL